MAATRHRGQQSGAGAVVHLLPRALAEPRLFERYTLAAAACRCGADAAPHRHGVLASAARRAGVAGGLCAWFDPRCRHAGAHPPAPSQSHRLPDTCKGCQKPT